MPYKFFEDVSLADVAFEATGKTIEEMFESAALAVTRTMVKDLRSVRRLVTKEIRVKADAVDTLLFNFLQEIVYYKDAKRLLFSGFDVRINQRKMELACTAEGEELDMKRHELIVDVKAVTYHKFEVDRTKRGWRAQVILDI